LLAAALKFSDCRGKKIPLLCPTLGRGGCSPSTFCSCAYDQLAHRPTTMLWVYCLPLPWLHFTTSVMGADLNNRPTLYFVMCTRVPRSQGWKMAPKNLLFLPRDASAERGDATASRLSTCPSVCPWRSGILFRRLV